MHNVRTRSPEQVFAILSCGVILVAILTVTLLPAGSPSSNQVVAAARQVATYATDYTPPSSLTQARSEIYQAIAVASGPALTVQRSFTRGKLYWFDLRTGSYAECVSHVVSADDPSNSLWAWVEYNGPCVPPY